VAGFPPRRPGFDPTSVYVGFVVAKVSFGEFSPSTSGFPCQFSFHRLLHASSIIWGWYKGEIVDDLPSGFSVTQPQELKKLEKNLSSTGSSIRGIIMLMEYCKRAGLGKWVEGLACAS
jgi:hypothetical protein